MFRKHAAKKRDSSSTPVVEEQNQVEEEEMIIEEIVDPSIEPDEDVTPVVEPTTICSSFYHAFSKLLVCYLNYLYLHFRLIMLFNSCVSNCEAIFMILYRIV